MESGSAVADPQVETPAPAAEELTGLRVFFTSGNSMDYFESAAELEDKLKNVYGIGDGVLLLLNPIGGGDTEYINLSNVERFKPIKRSG